MIPDYSFELHFPAASREAAVAGLARLCTGDTAPAVDAASADVVLALPPDEALEKWRADHPEMQQSGGKIHIGAITVWVKPKGDQVCLTLWPVTRAMQIACLDSPTVRRALVALLAEHGGVSGYLDRGDGSLVEMWPHDQLPPGYEHQLVKRLT